MNWNRKVVLVGLMPPPYPERLREEFPGLEIVDCHQARDRVAEEIADAHIVYGRVKPEEFTRARILEFIQADTQGVERLMYPELRESAAEIANAGDIYSPAIAEHTLALALALCRRLPEFLQAQQECRWRRDLAQFRLLAGQTVGFAGTGSIGLHCAMLFKGFGCRLLGFSRSGRCQAPFDEAVGLSKLLQRSDIVVLSLPHTPETNRLFDAEAFRRMKPEALFINVGRGKTVDEAALIAALQQGWIAGAGLDVFEQEPLPPESPLWRLPNVIITSHQSAGGVDYIEELYRLFAENLRRLRDGRPLLHRVDKERGY